MSDHPQPNHPLTQFHQLVQQLVLMLPDVKERLAASEKGPLNDHLVDFFRFKQDRDLLKKTSEAFGGIFETHNKVVLPKRFEDADQDRVRIPSVAHSFGIIDRYSASIVDKDKARPWLEARGGSELYVETVNAGTLASFLRQYAEDHNEEPPEDVIKFTRYRTIGINKYTPKPE